MFLYFRYVVDFAAREPLYVAVMRLQALASFQPISQVYGGKRQLLQYTAVRRQFVTHQRRPHQAGLALGGRGCQTEVGLAGELMTLDSHCLASLDILTTRFIGQTHSVLEFRWVRPSMTDAAHSYLLVYIP